MLPLKIHGGFMLTFFGFVFGIFFSSWVLFYIRNLSKQVAQLQTFSSQDPLTGLANKKKVYEELEHSFASLKRSHRDLGARGAVHFSVTFIDLDGFKAVNDGDHLRGDRVLIEFGEYLVANTRKVDIVGRFGGDEFFIITPNTTYLQGQEFCKKLLDGLELYQFDSRNEPLKLDASVASASTSEGYEGYMEMVQKADERMQVQKDSKKRHR